MNGTAAIHPASPRASDRPSGWWWLAAVLAAAIAAYSLRHAIVGERAWVPELADSFRARPRTIQLHTLFGPFALVLGLVNLLPALRQRARWGLHRLSGRVYVISALVLGVEGGVLARSAAGGTGSRVGFMLLAIATVATTLRAWERIRARDVTAHREWMLRSYSLIFGAVTLRLWLPVLIVAYHGQFESAYRWVAWLAWVPNLAWAEWRIRRGWHPRFTLAETFAARVERPPRTSSPA